MAFSPKTKDSDRQMNILLLLLCEDSMKNAKSKVKLYFFNEKIAVASKYVLFMMLRFDDEKYLHRG
jgi:hypothetical protein